MLRAVALAGIAATPLMLPGTAQAATWQGMTGLYNADVNWSGGAVPEGGTATFINNGAVTSVTVTVGGGSLALLEYASGAPAYTLTVQPGLGFDITNITNNSSVEQNLFIGVTGGINILGTISGRVALIADGGAFQFADDVSALDTRFIGVGGFLNMTGGTVSIGSIEGTGIIRVGGTLSVGSLNSDTTYSGTIQDGIALTKVGTGTLTLAGSNLYTGATNITGGTLRGGATNTFSLSSDMSVGAAGTLDLGGFDQTVPSLAGAGTITNSGPDNAVLTTGGDDSSTTFSGVIQNGAATTGLTKTGIGTLTLSGANTYTGGTTISGGTIALSGAGALAATGAVDLDASGAVFSIGLANGDRTIGALSGVSGSFVTLGSNSLTAGAAADSSFAGEISGSGSFIKAGAGTLTLTGANFYVGGTVVTAGILEVSGTGSITHMTGTTALSGGQLNIVGGGVVTDFNGFIANVAGNVAEVLVDGTGSTWTNSGDLRVGFGGTGTLTVSDGGTLASGGSLAIIGDAATAVGTMTVTGAGSSWNVNDSNLIVGNDGSGTLTVSATATVTVDGATSVGGGTDGTGDGTLTVTGATSSFTTNGIFVGVDDATGSVSVLAGATLLSEDGTGPGALLGITNIGANGTALVSGTNSLWSTDSFFYLTGSLTVADGGEVSVGSGGFATITLSPLDAGGVLNIGAAVGEVAVAPGILDLSRVTSTLAGTLNFNHTSANYTFSPVIAGLTTVNAVAGTTILSGTNTYTGGTTIGDANLQVGNASALGTGGVNMTDGDARLILDGYQVGIAGLDGITDAEVDLGSSGTSALGVVGASGSYSFAGNIIGGIDPLAAALVKDGASTQILSGDNTFMGAVDVVDGTLVLASNTALSSNAFVAVGADGQLTVNDGVDVTIAELFDSGPSGAVLLDGTSSLTVALTGADNSFGGIISGTGAFIVDGDNLIQTLTGVSTYTGGTTIADGTLALSGAGALAATGALALTSATAVFDMSGVTGDRTIGDLSGVTGSSVVLGAQGLTVGTANDTSFAGIISGVGGTLTKAGTGMLALGGINTFTGLTTLSGGTLQVNGSLAGALTAQTGTTLQGIGSIGGVVTMNDGSTLAAGNSPGTLTVGSLVLNAGTSLDFELGDAGVVGGATNDLVIVNDDLTLAGVLNVSDSGTFGLGTYTLFTYGGDLTQNPLTFGDAPIGYNAGNFSLNTATAGTVELIVAAAATDQYWIGGTGTWNAVNTNWTDESGGIAATWGGQTGIFRGTAGTVTVDGVQSFNALRFESDGYVLQGDALAIAGVQGDVRVDTGFTATINNVITGTGRLAKGGAGTLVLTGLNTYSGGTLVAGGVLAISVDGNLGDASGGVTLDGGTLRLAGPGNVVSARAFTIGASGGAIDTNGLQLDLVNVSGPGTLTKLGANYLDLNGSINLAGGLVVQGGGVDIHLGSAATFTGNINGAAGTEVALLLSGTDNVYAGVISGDTHLYVGTDGPTPATVTLSGVSTYTNHTYVDFGATLALTGAGSIAGTDELDLVGTFDISGTDNGASIGSLYSDGTVLLGDKTLTLTGASGLFEGTIQGTGGLTVLTGVQGFAGTSTYSGATYIAPEAVMAAVAPNALSAASAFTVDGALIVLADTTIGSLAGSGFVGMADPSELAPITFTLGGDSTSTVFSGTLAGEGTLQKTGAGIFSLTGDLSEFDGGLAVNGGTLAINTVFTGGVDVLGGGTLGGGGTIGSFTAASGGIVAPGNSIGTLSVTGNASFAAGSTYQVEIDPTGASDLLAVGGIATLGGATVDVLKAAGSFTAGTRYTILTAAGGLDGTFGTLTQNMPFLDLALAYDASDVYLDITRNEVAFPSVGNTPNERAVGGAVETLGPGNPLYDSVVSQDSVASARAAFNALSGEIGASAKGVLVNDSQFVRNAVFERLVTAGSAAPSGMSVAPLGYVAPTKSAVPYPTKAEPLAVAAPTSAFWAQGFGSWGSTDGNGNAASINRDTGGFFIGADTLVGDWRLGALGGYSQTSFDVDARSSSGESDNIHAGIYAGTNWGAVAFRAGAAYTWNDISTSRNVNIPTPQLIEADYDAGTAQVFGELGYGLAWGSVNFEPFAGLAYVNLNTDGFSETGGPAALNSSSDSTDATYTTLGLRASTTFDTGAYTTTLRGMLGWRHAFGDITPTTAYQFAAGGSPFTVEGLPIAEDALVMDFGLDIALSDAASLGVFYSAQFGDSAQDQSVRGTLNWKF